LLELAEESIQAETQVPRFARDDNLFDDGRFDFLLTTGLIFIADLSFLFTKGFYSDDERKTRLLRSAGCEPHGH
jgi:hypothetical protein